MWTDRSTYFFFCPAAICGMGDSNSLRAMEAAAMREKIPTRDRIIDAATMLFWCDGYHAVSTEQICKKAGVAKSSLYHAFESKAAILGACLDSVWTRNWEEISRIYETPGSDREHLERHLQWVVSSQLKIRETYGMFLGTFDMALGTAIPVEVATEMVDHQREHTALLTKTIAAVAALDPESPRARWLSDVASDVMTGATIKARSRNDVASLFSLTDTIFELIELAKT
ncbi:TetR/AcrR family transcriptional regulator [Novosphingobium sp. FKTRR1]|uniref:TetR/AcrR family transcriptional regulator n=1 Tax=Novosphingobium sp. FKTRR1 TaxID=2879118 RepID=UPI001CF07FCA|nr:TetR/AcrR family transcriptional regulator [Novosphingobium sp. FKTRR1]